jgi:hypothetical protein
MDRNTHLYDICTKHHVYEFYDTLNKWCRDGIDLQWIRNATLVLHASVAIATAILFQFQMAILHSNHHILVFPFWKKVCTVKIRKINAHAKYNQ